MNLIGILKRSVGVSIIVECLFSCSFQSSSTLVNNLPTIRPYQEPSHKETLWKPRGMPKGVAYEEMEARIQKLVKVPMTVRNSDLQILSEGVSHVITRFSNPGADDTSESLDFRLPALTEITPKGNFDNLDHIDAIILEKGLSRLKLDSSIRIPLLVKGPKIYRASLLCIGDSENSCSKPYSNAIFDNLYQKSKKLIQVFPKIRNSILREELQSDQFWVIRFVALTVPYKIRRFGFNNSAAILNLSKQFQSYLHYPISADQNIYLQQACELALARYRLLVPRPTLIDFLQRFPLATSDISARATNEIIQNIYSWPKAVYPHLQSWIVTGSNLDEQKQISLTDEIYSWNVIAENNDIQSLISLDVPPSLSAHLNESFQENTLEWLKKKLNHIDNESSLRVVQLSSENNDIIVAKDIKSSLFDVIPNEKISIIQEIRRKNPEDQILERIADQIFPEKSSTSTTVTYKKVKKILSFKEYAPSQYVSQTFFDPRTKFSCEHALCYQQEGFHDYFRIFLEQHTVNYGPKGKIAFYIPIDTKYSLYTPFYPLDSSMKKIKVGSRPITMRFWDHRRKNIFHMMFPALDTLYPDNSTYPYVYRDEYFQYRFDPTGRTSEKWFGMGWQPNFQGRELKTVLLSAPEIRWVKDEFHVRESKKFIKEYFKKFPVSDYLRINEIFQNLAYSDRRGLSIRFNPNFKIIGLNKKNPTDEFPHYLKEPTPEELHRFWSDRNVLARYYEVRLKLYSYVADESISFPEG